MFISCGGEEQHIGFLYVWCVFSYPFPFLCAVVSGSGQSVMDPGVQERRWRVGGKGQSVRSG